MCTNLNLEIVKIELDVKIVFDWVAENYSSNFHHVSLILDYRTLINQIP